MFSFKSTVQHRLRQQLACATCLTLGAYGLTMSAAQANSPIDSPADTPDQRTAALPSMGSVRARRSAGPSSGASSGTPSGVSSGVGAIATHSVFPAGLNLDNRNVAPSVFVRGLTNDTQAVDLYAWQLPVSEVFEALNITASPLGNGQLELSAPGLLTRIEIDDLVVDPELGRVISVRSLETLLDVDVSFDMADYALVLVPPWLNPTNASPLQAPPVIVEGLPVVAAPSLSMSSIRQRTVVSGTRGSNGGDRTTVQGDLSATGTAFGGSWYARLNQQDLSDSATWRLNEAQYLRQTEATDTVLGSHPTFWPSQGGSSYWGATVVRRYGFEPTHPGSGGFSPQQRLQSEGMARTIIGEAAPGTLVQLATALDNQLVSEVLVDSSGAYRFENVQAPAGQRFQILLYPNGQLTATPEIRNAQYLELPGQLAAGTSALAVSAGGRQVSDNSFLGDFQSAAGGLAYRWGVDENLTLGVGAVYDQSVQGLGELFYQPGDFPLRVAVSALAGENGADYNASLLFDPSPDVNLTLSADQLSQRFQTSWQVNPGLSLRTSGNTRENALAVGANVSVSGQDGYVAGSGDIDTNGNLRWSLNSRWSQLQLSHRGNELTTDTELAYGLSGQPAIGSTAFVAYNTQQLSDQSHRSLLEAGLRYRSDGRNAAGVNLWEIDAGYGISTSDSGIRARAATTAIPGLTVGARYEEVSTLSDQTTFSIELSPTLSTHSGVALSSTTPEDIRGEGLILVQPFLDANGNGTQDAGEQDYTEDLELLVLLNNQTTNRLRPEMTDQGLSVQMEPGLHRIDLDPAGYPLDWRPIQRAYAVQVAAGARTIMPVPLARAYTISGVITTPSQAAVSGATVEAVPTDGGLPVSSVTNRAGAFFLEGLRQGEYELWVDGVRSHPQQLELTADTPAFQELNLLSSQRSAAF